MSSKSLSFRLLQSSDFYDYLSLVSNNLVMQYTKGKPLTIIEARSKFDNIIDKNLVGSGLGVYAFFTLQGNNFVGVSKLGASVDMGFELGYSLLPQYWHQGYGTEMANAMIDLSQDIPNVHSISAVTDPDNIASQKILANLGFELNRELVWQGRLALMYIFSR